MGVDYDMMRRILQVKLIMDGRRIPTVMSGGSVKKDENNGFVKSLWIYALMGAITIPFLLMKENYLFQMSIVFGILIFMVMSSVISDFSFVLLDLRDKNIMATKPVGSRTVNAAKMLHVTVYLFWLTAAFTGIPLIVSLVRNGFLFFLIFLAEIILIDLFAVVLTALIYLAVLKFFDGEKLRDVINYVQIALALAVTIGYQLIGRLFSITLIHIEFVPQWWQVFIVPVWFAAPFEIMLRGATNGSYILFTVLAVLVPVFSMILYIRLMPSFERNLQKLNSYGTGAGKGNGKLREMIEKAICFSKEERLFFRFTSAMIKNEREFKLKVYPLLGLAVMMPFILVLSGIHSDGLPNFHNSRIYLYAYFCGIPLVTLLIMSRCSSNYKGAWIYKMVPMANLSPVFKGTVKALLAGLFMPVFCLESVVFLLLCGIGILPGLIAMLLNFLLHMAVCFKFLKHILPFSEAFGVKQDDEWSGAALLFVLGALAAIQLALSFLRYGVLIDIAAAAIANIIMWKKVFRLSWKDLEE
jgi:hypothetical protein